MTYNSQHLDLALKSYTADLQKYTRNGQWTLVSVNATKNTVKYSCCRHPFVDITFTVQIRRRHLFYVQNLILPYILLATLSVFSFSLLPTGFWGENCFGHHVYSWTYRLYVYFHWEHSSNIRGHTFDKQVLHRHFVWSSRLSDRHIGHPSILPFQWPRRRNSPWVEFFVFGCLARVLRMKLNVKSSENRETMRSKRQSKGATFLSKLLICKGGAHFSFSGNQMEVKKSCELRNPMDKRVEEITHKISDIYGKVVEQENMAGNKDKWHFAASVIDRFFLILLGVTICLSVITFYFMIPRYEWQKMIT